MGKNVGDKLETIFAREIKSVISISTVNKNSLVGTRQGRKAEEAS